MYETKKEVEDWLISMKIANYVINEDLTVDVEGNVNISYKNLKEIPVKFGKINGGFSCSDNALTSLEGCPRIVNGSFYCNYNHLGSLDYCPEVINGSFNCSNNEINKFKRMSKSNRW